MIKRTLYFGNPAYLSLSNNQLVVRKAEDGDLPPNADGEYMKSIPIEDIGVVIIDNRQITVTIGVLTALLDNNAAVVTCDSKSSMPIGLLLPLDGNKVQSERFRDQLEASLPLKKQMWQQTIENKIRNQAGVLEYATGVCPRNMLAWAGSVKSGDSDNMEGRAAAFYWKNVFPSIPDFNRGRFEGAPNNLLNYGYAILRAVIARALVASGLLPAIGIHHHNRYNAYCLADDIMEPYRPFVDRLVADLIKEDGIPPALTKEVKAKFLSIPAIDVFIDGRRSPLMIAVTQTTTSLFKCFSGESRKLVYPEFRCPD